jgi:hypothetical protein
MAVDRPKQINADPKIVGDRKIFFMIVTDGFLLCASNEILSRPIIKELKVRFLL